MINNSKRLKNQEHKTNLDSSSQFNYHFPIKSQKPNNISFKNSVYLMKSEKRTNTHRQYLIDFIRDNNNKNIRQNSKNVIKEEQDEKDQSLHAASAARRILNPPSTTSCRRRRSRTMVSSTGCRT